MANNYEATVDDAMPHPVGDSEPNGVHHFEDNPDLLNFGAEGGAADDVLELGDNQELEFKLPPITMQH